MVSYVGKDMHIRIVKLNKNHVWEEVKLYKKENEEFKPIDLWPVRDYELFEILTDVDIPNKPIYMDDLPDDLKAEITDYSQGIGCYDFYEINFADLMTYLLIHPKVRDLDYEAKNDKDFEKNAWKPNPVKRLEKVVRSALDFYDWYWGFDNWNSDVRILYWFDC